MNKYLIVSPYPPPYLGGHLVYLATLVDNCKISFDILTHRIPGGEREIICKKDRPIRKRWIRTMFKEPTLFENTVTYTYFLLWILLKNIFSKYNAIIVNWAPAPNSLVHILGKVIGVPTIGVLLGEEITVTQKSKGFKGAVKRILMQWGYRRANGFIACCHFIRDRAIELGVDSTTIDLIPISYNPKNIGPSRRRRGGSRLISIGTLVERKGFHLLVDAVYALKGEFPELKLDIVGDGPFMPVIRDRVRKYCLEDRVILHGKMFEEKLASLLSEADLFVLANTMMEDGNTEGAPMVIADASANGLPVIGGTGGGLESIIVNGVTGFIVNSLDISELAGSIRQILTSPELAEKMGNAGREYIKRDHDPIKLGQLFGKTILRATASNEKSLL